MSKRLDIEYCKNCEDIYATYPQVWLCFGNLIGESFRKEETTFNCPRCSTLIRRNVGYIEALEKRDDREFLLTVVSETTDLSQDASNLLLMLLSNFSVPSFAVHLEGKPGKSMEELSKKRYIEVTTSNDIFFAVLNAKKLGLFYNDAILGEMSNQTSFLWHPEYLVSNREHTHRRKARREALVDDFTDEERVTMFESFGNVCALTGKDVPLHVDHVLPLAIGHGGTTLSNMLPIGQRLNSSKGAKNIFEWYEADGERFEVLPELFDKAIGYLAELNEMTTQEYRDYVYECHANPNDILTEAI